MVTTALSGDDAASYLRRPYARVVIPESDGTYRGEILEFPGCIATGDTPAEALEALEEVAAEWLEAALERGQSIPEPVENNEFSGRLVLRMPKSLHKKAARIAERDGVSLNQFILMSLAEQIGEQAHPRHQITFSTVASGAVSGLTGASTTGYQFVVSNAMMNNPQFGTARVSPADWTTTNIPIRRVR